MGALRQQVEQVVSRCQSLPPESAVAEAEALFAGLLRRWSPNPTGDDPITLPDELAGFEAPAFLKPAYDEFRGSMERLHLAQQALPDAAKAALAGAIASLCDHGFVHASLADKFRLPENRRFLDRALLNAACPWQLALVAHWALNAEGFDRFRHEWANHFGELSPDDLVKTAMDRICFNGITSLRDYRRDAMHHYPKLSGDEFTALQSESWRDVIDRPSGRRPEQDIPNISPFVKQGDIEHSLYRHYLMPDLLDHLRRVTPARSGDFDLQDRDLPVLLSLPVVLQQAQEEVFQQVKAGIADGIRQWTADCRRDDGSERQAALAIAEKIWNYRRAPAASDCSTPEENLIKGFTATIRNAFSHFTDVNFAASHGNRLDPLDVAEKFVFFASVSNGQLDNLSTAHRDYLQSLDNPAHWDNEVFFRHFLAVNRRTDPQHIQAHFLIDKTRGCPAVPQIARFHEVVLDLVLDYLLGQFGEDNLRKAGTWYLDEKTPGAFG